MSPPDRTGERELEAAKAGRDDKLGPWSGGTKLLAWKMTTCFKSKGEA